MCFASINKRGGGVETPAHARLRARNGVARLTMLFDGRCCCSLAALVFLSGSRSCRLFSGLRQPRATTFVEGRSGLRRSVHALRGVLHAIAFEFPEQRWPGDAQNASCLALIIARLCEGVLDGSSFDVAESKIADVQLRIHIAGP